MGLRFAPPTYGSPLFYRSIEIEDAMIMAPLKDDIRIDIPSEVEEEIASKEVFAEYFIEIGLSDLLLDICCASFKSLCDS